MNKEQVYDEKIAPLMAQIIGICHEHNIGMVADFEIPNDEDQDLCCTSGTPGDGGQISRRHSLARSMLMGEARAFAFTISGKDA